LGLLGVTVVVSSGDNGAYGNANKLCEGGFQPIFLASSPYVLSVGATQLQYEDNTNGGCVSEIAASVDKGSLITSGGGFSEIFPRPHYQDNVIQSVKMRGYPDVSLLGHNFNVIIEGKITSIDGTSASAPTLAGFLSLANDYRLQNGLRPFGFINNLLYQMYVDNPKAFRDIVVGENSCLSMGICCEQGYSATIGWDPVTGLGSIDFRNAWEYLTSSLDRPFSKEKCNPSDADLGLYGSTATLNSLKREKDFQKIEILLWIIALTLCGFIVFILYFKYIKLNKPVPLLEKKNPTYVSYNSV